MSQTQAGWRHFAAILCAGSLGALGLAPYGIWVATLISLAVAFWGFGRAARPRDAFLTGWAYGTGYFGLGLLWIVEPFFVQPEVHGWMAPFALLFLSAGLALFWGAAFAVASRAPFAPWLALTLCWGLAELARAYVFTGFPWAGFAQVWVGLGPDQLLAWIGPHGLGVLTLLCGLCLCTLVRRRLALLWRLACVGVLAAVLGGGVWLQARLPEGARSDATVRLVQPNAPQDQKWHPDFAWEFLDRQLTYSAVAPAPDLIIWPETAIPAWLGQAGPILADIAAAAGDVPVIAGIQRREGQRIFNAAFLAEGGEVSQLYDKHHLVPFGEYIPLGNLAARFGLSGFATQSGQGFSAGPGPSLLDLGPLGQALPLICYEAVFPQHARADAGRADVLLQITNDAWFGERSGPYQHLAQAQMRAIEQGLPLLRAANTGVSAAIDPYGRITAQIPLGQAGFVDVALPPPLPATLYARTGDWPILALLLAAAALGWGLRGLNPAAK